MIWKDYFDAADIFQNKSIIIFSVIFSEVETSTEKQTLICIRKAKSLQKNHFFRGHSKGFLLKPILY